MNLEQLEFQITQYLDGTLSEGQRAALEQRLSADPEARRLLEEHRRVDALLKQMPPVPQVNWDALAQHISASVAQQEAPVRHYSLTWLTRPSRLAAAAALLLATGLAWTLLRQDRSEVSTILADAPIAQVIGPQPEPSRGQAIAQIEIGPSSLARNGADVFYGEDVVIRPSQVVIASGSFPAQDIEQAFY